MVRRREDMKIEITEYTKIYPVPVYNLNIEREKLPPTTGDFLAIMDESYYTNSKRTCLVKAENEYKNQKRLKLTLEDLLWDWK